MSSDYRRDTGGNGKRRESYVGFFDMRGPKKTVHDARASGSRIGIGTRCSVLSSPA